MFSGFLAEVNEEKRRKELDHITQLQLYEEEERKRKNREKQSEISFGTEKDSVYCAFYLKTGCCRYGDTCSKYHPYPNGSTTILIKNMYDGLGMSDVADEDNDDDLEYDEDEILNHFNEFFNDVVPVFEQYGKIVYVRVCRNHSSHLRGNVYIQYENEGQALAALKGLVGRYYALKSIVAEFCPVINWKSAVCGLYRKQTCQRGKLCNFLHVFPNPGGVFEGALGRGNDEDRSPKRRRSRSPRRNRNRRDDKPRKNRSKSPRKRRHSRGREKSPNRSKVQNKRSKSRSSSRKRQRNH